MLGIFWRNVVQFPTGIQGRSRLGEHCVQRDDSLWGMMDQATLVSLAPEKFPKGEGRWDFWRWVSSTDPRGGEGGTNQRESSGGACALADCVLPYFLFRCTERERYSGAISSVHCR